MIVRSPRPEHGYLTISNDLARDQSLSYRARGVLIAILSRPDNWSTTATQLAAEGKEGRDAILTALDELEAARYVRRVKVQNDRGQWSTQTLVFDSPEPENPSSVPLGETVSPLVTPEPEKPDSENQALIEVPKKKNQTHTSADADRSDETTDSASVAADPFDEFWSTYPRTKDVSKKTARTSFERIQREKPKPDVLGPVRRYAAKVRRAGTEPRFIPHPATWLNQRRFEAEDLAETAADAPIDGRTAWWANV